MNCALDLIAIKATAIAEYEEAERLKDEQAKRDYLKCGERTIEFCEKVINDRLTEKAEKRLPLEVFLRVAKTTDRLDNEVFRLIQPDGAKYANGTLSYTPTGKMLSLDVLIAYLNEHCIQVSMTDDFYQTYGLGAQKCKKIRIFVPKVEE